VLTAIPSLQEMMEGVTWDTSLFCRGGFPAL
jgi:hypothetical protein